MMRVGRVVVVVSSMLLLVGASSCRQRKLERWAWVGEELSGPDIPFTCTSALRGTAIHLDCKDLPAETTVGIGGKEHPASSPFHAEVDVGDALGTTLLSDLARPGFELDPRTPLVIATPRGTVTTELPKVKNVTSGLVHGVGNAQPVGIAAKRQLLPAGHRDPFDGYLDVVQAERLDDSPRQRQGGLVAIDRQGA